MPWQLSWGHKDTLRLKICATSKQRRSLHPNDVFFPYWIENLTTTRLWESCINLNVDFREITYIRSATVLRGRLHWEIRKALMRVWVLLLSWSTWRVSDSPVRGESRATRDTWDCTQQHPLSSLPSDICWAIFHATPGHEKQNQSLFLDSAPGCLPRLSTRLSQCFVGEMLAKAIMHGTFQPIWLSQVVRGNIPNYKAGLEPPGGFPASATHCWLSVNMALLHQ